MIIIPYDSHSIGGRSQGGSMDFSSAFNENTQNISEARISSTNSLGLPYLPLDALLCIMPYNK